MKVRQLAYIIVFIALSGMGAMIKIPSPIGTIGLDSGPGYFASLAFGYGYGISIIGLGHLFTSGLVGFPLGLPTHIIIAVLMILWAVLFRYLNKKVGKVIACIIVIICNGILSAFVMYPMAGFSGVIGLIPFLLLGSIFNVLIAQVTYNTYVQIRKDREWD
ncbi:hypothetical protein [Spirochaeta cellobiosiphila]|uniref:hypothetical protein n=1 Tax=Spirochaeta cellobiosiphila TaxID=504483 RepID=UPI00040C1E5B|nr:hypothetical protein [Spirochaeta cellobiosiphila]